MKRIAKRSILTIAVMLFGILKYSLDLVVIGRKEANENVKDLFRDAREDLK